MVVGSFPLVRLTQRFDRRAVIVWSLVALAASVALTALAPAYPLALAGRLAGALSVGLLRATTNAYTADLVADRDLAPGRRRALGGATLRTVPGTPTISLVAQGTGWRAAFCKPPRAALSGCRRRRCARSCAGRIRTPQPLAAHPDGRLTRLLRRLMTFRGVPATHSRSIRPMVTIVALIALSLVGHYGMYTYITRLVEAPASQVPGGIGAMLLVFGLASAAGVAVAGRFGERTDRAIVVSAIAHRHRPSPHSASSRCIRSSASPCSCSGAWRPARCRRSRRR